METMVADVQHPPAAFAVFALDIEHQALEDRIVGPLGTHGNRSFLGRTSSSSYAASTPLFSLHSFGCFNYGAKNGENQKCRKRFRGFPFHPADPARAHNGCRAQTDSARYELYPSSSTGFSHVSLRGRRYC